MSVPPDPNAVPRCRVTSIYVDAGPAEEPEIYGVRDLRGQWGFSRQQFLSKCAGLGCLSLFALMGVTMVTSSEACDVDSPTTDDSTTGPGSGGTGGGTGGGGTYCQCDQICTCVPVV
jgi:hypothetical protein